MLQGSGGRRRVFRSCCSQSGPCFHSSLTDSFLGDNPRDGMSAGLVLPEQWSQHSTGTNLLISFTRFWINVFQSFPVPLIQNSAICESGKHLGASSVNLVARLSMTFFTSLASRSAERSSSLGIVITLKVKLVLWPQQNLIAYPLM